MTLQLYVHIPFCIRKCFYCDFCSVPARSEEMAAYCASLCREMVLVGQAWQNARVSTVFVGGGTPSLLPTPLWGQVLHALRDSFHFGEAVEFTVEANPGTLTEEWLALGMAQGVNRLSLGVQAAQRPLLEGLGRIHTFDQAAEAVQLAKAQGLTNINVDVMMGLPGQTLQDYLETLEEVEALGPTHVSAYGLQVEEGTPLAASLEAGEIALPDPELAADMAEAGMAWLAGRGYAQYEISNFAKPGFACRHNLGYWHGAWYAGMGLAAHSMVPPDRGGFPPLDVVGTDRPGGETQAQPPAYFRLENEADMAAYLARLDRGERPIRACTPISRKEAMFETMMLGLRTVGGVSAEAFRGRHGSTLEEAYGRQLGGLVAEGLGHWHSPKEGASAKSFFALTPRGMGLQNQVLLRFME